MLPFRVAPEMSQECILAVIPWPTVTLHKVHSAVPALLRDKYAFTALNNINHFGADCPAPPGVWRLAITDQSAENPQPSADGVGRGPTRWHDIGERRW